MGEQNCPQFCAFCEGCICNFLAVSASRNYVSNMPSPVMMMIDDDDDDYDHHQRRPSSTR